ncbi:PucR family transcriptional regulator [Brevibacillus sp. B_LB10_24]|uniref:PucR family transcriptional regulator n=1 Tax=Brevibacillus sp. B_LB10_24 TaxID=3380645 RepID=UPI0038BB1771
MEKAAFTVEDLLRLPVMKDAKLVSGEGGIQKEIYYVDIMEIPDMEGWLRPKEFVLTTGYSFQDQPLHLSRLLEEMKRVGGSAVGLKSKRFLQKTPADAIAKSNEYQIPIIDIPPEVTYIDITHSVMENILNKQLVLLRKVNDVSSMFTDLVLNRRGSELVSMIGKLLNCETAIMNSDGVIESATPLFSPDAVAVTKPVQIGGKILGYLHMTKPLDDDDPFLKMCIDQALTMLALEFTIRESARHRKEHAREDFLIELLSGTTRMEDILRYRARELQFSRGRYQYIISLKTYEAEDGEAGVDTVEKWEYIRDVILKEIRRTKRISAAMAMGENIAVLCTTNQTDPVGQWRESLEVADELYLRINSRLPAVELYIGVGGMTDKLSRIKDSFDMSRRALEAGRRVRRDRKIIHYSDIYVEDMLISLREHPALTSMYNQLLKPVREYDQENGTDLFKTLECYVRRGGNTKQVAEELFVHRNSVNYRLERIQSIVGADLGDPETRLRLDLILRAWKLGILS